MLTVVLPSEHRAGAKDWGLDVEEPIQQSLGPISRPPSQTVCAQFCKHLRPPLPLVVGTELKTVLKFCEESFPDSGTQSRGLSVT